MHPFWTRDIPSALEHLSTIKRRYHLELSMVYSLQCHSPFLFICRTGFRVQGTSVALLQRWYSLVREKRPTRQDFLKSLVKVFQENPNYQSSQVCGLWVFLATCTHSSCRMISISLDTWLKTSQRSSIKPKKRSSPSSSILQPYCQLQECSFWK